MTSHSIITGSREGFRHLEVAAQRMGACTTSTPRPMNTAWKMFLPVEKTDDMIQYDKVQPEHRIDLFDASVFACIRYLDNMERQKKGKSGGMERRIMSKKKRSRPQARAEPREEERRMAVFRRRL